MKKINYAYHSRFWSETELEEIEKNFNDSIFKGDLQYLSLPRIYLSEPLFDKMIECIEHSPNLKYFNYSKIHLKPEYLNRLLEALEACPAIQVIEMEDCNFREPSFNSFISLIIGSMSLKKLNLKCEIPFFLPKALEENFMSAILKSNSLEEVIVENRALLSDEVKKYLETNKKRSKDLIEYSFSSDKDFSDNDSLEEDFLDEEDANFSLRC